jgi:hypothetical protein
MNFETFIIILYIKVMELFDFVNSLFSKEKYSKIKNVEKPKHFFMTQRFMSIKYPVVANEFNIIGISYTVILDYWHKQMSNIYTTPPNWMYVKTKKAKEEKALKNNIPSEDAIEIYLKKTGYTRQELNDAISFFGDVTYDPIRKLDAVINDKVKVKKTDKSVDYDEDVKNNNMLF